MTKSAIQIPNDKPCAFCAYLEGTRPFTFITRNELVAVMVTREQRGKPHLLVIPISHRSTILELTDTECAELMKSVRNASKAINSAFQRPGISIWQSNGVAASQTISHFHFHVAGTLDSGGTEWGEVNECSLADTELIAEQIRSHWP